ncbi:mRNA turnover protein 4 homolog [Rhopilema esculentum]|uniref:mRNA turnover protein 4 homolog n=1 Tax=Rhopilema esculentum TaxID=499914 RepID=UPI0031DD9682|eukprot:gene8092-14008_t
MPKSKRNKIVTLSKTTSKGMELKKELVDKVKTSVDEFAYIYIFSVENMRNSKIKDIRNEWRSSRFFFGKNKVMAVALGRSHEDEYKENLHEVSKRLKGNVGLLFTNKSREEVLRWFEKYRDLDYSRTGNIATKDIALPEGPLDPEDFSFSMEPQLRQLGLPTELRKGIIHLTEEYKVCKEGDTLTPEQCRILKLFNHPLSEFRVKLTHVWSSSGVFEELENGDIDAEVDTTIE